MHSVLLQIGPFTIYGYGFMIALGILAAFGISIRRAARNGLDPDLMFSLGLTGVLAGLAGAKVLYWITELPEILKDPSCLLHIGEGFVVYGGIIFGLVCPYLYARRKKAAFLDYADIAAAGIAVGQGFGRLGCFMAGCCYGKETTAFWGLVFPEGSLAPAGTALIPTQLISAGGDFLIALFLVSFYKKRRFSGEMLALYLLLYSAGRFAVEFLRGDPRGTVGLLSTSQFIAIFTFAAGAAFFLIRKKKGSAL